MKLGANLHNTPPPKGEGEKPNLPNVYVLLWGGKGKFLGIYPLDINNCLQEVDITNWSL